MQLGYALKWPLISWMFVCLVLANAYSGLFYSLLVLQETEPPINTIEQFIEYITENTKLELVSSDYTEQLFLQAKPENELFYRIGQRFNRLLIFKIN